LQIELAHAVRAHSAILDGEIVCLDVDGRSLFNRLLFRRDWPHFVAFDVLAIDGEDLRGKPLVERKRRLRAIMPRIESRLVYMDHVETRGAALFDAVCARDLEGVVAKWKRGRYHSDGFTTSWLKIRNGGYSQIEGRPELFGARRVGSPSKSAKPVLCAELQALQRTGTAR
jgi:bifunctional non-homologous end joining protein LigD